MKLLPYISLLLLISCQQKASQIYSIENNSKAAPDGFFAYTNIDNAIACSQQTNKPILLIFTGYAASADPRAIWRILEFPESKKLINDSFILATLYVDDRRKLDQIDSTKRNYKGDVIETIGQQNANFQIEHFKTNSQPYFVIIDHQFKVLTTPIGYLPKNEIPRFAEFLKEGLKEYSAN
jgi:thiol:disulfide interchange protein DsbD